MSESLERYLDHLGLERGLSTHSLDSYRNDIEKFRRYLEQSGLEPGSLRQVDLAGFLEHLRKSGMAPSSIARNLSSIKGFYRFLKRNGETTGNPAETITGPRIMRTHPGAMSVEEVFLLLDTARAACRKERGKKKLAIRDWAILEFMYGTGSRVSEAAEIKRDDLYREMGLVRLFGKGQKERVVPMGRTAWEAVRDYMEVCRPCIAGSKSGDYLFLNNRGGKLSRMGIWKILNKYVKASGISRKVSPHTLRHSFATHLLAGGADLIAVQELLGHADITTTEIYTHIDKDFLITEHREFHPREKW